MHIITHTSRGWSVKRLRLSPHKKLYLWYFLFSNSPGTTGNIPEERETTSWKIVG